MAWNPRHAGARVFGVEEAPARTADRLDSREGQGLVPDDGGSADRAGRSSFSAVIGGGRRRAFVAPSGDAGALFPGTAPRGYRLAGRGAVRVDRCVARDVGGVGARAVSGRAGGPVFWMGGGSGGGDRKDPECPGGGREDFWRCAGGQSGEGAMVGPDGDRAAGAGEIRSLEIGRPAGGEIESSRVFQVAS